MELQRMREPEQSPDQAIIAKARRVHRDLTSAPLYEEALRRNEAVLVDTGALAANTGEYTGRSPRDKYIVREPSSERDIWWGDVNAPLSEQHFAGLRERVQAHLAAGEVFVQDVHACADPAYRLRVRLITETAWHNLFARTLFIPIAPGQASSTAAPDFVVLHAPRFHASPERDGTRTGTVIALDFARRLLLIGGTAYAGEIKKSIFTVLNYLLPKRGVLSMHCSANEGPRGDVALFFGLSGTGKTSLGTDPERAIIGDDEHGWNDRGVFNFEGGLYAKVIRLSAQAEPQIWSATNRFGAILENVVVDPVTRRPSYDDASLTENTRSAFPISFISNADRDRLGGHPRNIIFLTADAFGILPPVAHLDHAQALYHFLSGYTAKVAGTERGLDPEPEATFSTCFAAPFLPLRPAVYARLLGEKIARHEVDCWLVNTGWIGGAFGLGQRISIAHSRAIVHAILNGALAKVPKHVDPIFGLAVPEQCPGVPSDILQPRRSWPDPETYDQQARALARRFLDNFAQFAADVAPTIRAAGPRPD